MRSLSCGAKNDQQVAEKAEEAGEEGSKKAAGDFTDVLIQARQFRSTKNADPASPPVDRERLGLGDPSALIGPDQLKRIRINWDRFTTIRGENRCSYYTTEPYFLISHNTIRVWEERVHESRDPER